MPAVVTALPLLTLLDLMADGLKDAGSAQGTVRDTSSWHGSIFNGWPRHGTDHFIRLDFVGFCWILLDFTGFATGSERFCGDFVEIQGRIG